MGSSKEGTTTTISLSPEQRELIGLTIPTFRQYLGQTPEVGPRPVVGPNELQELGQFSALNSVPGILNRFEQGQEGLQGGKDFFSAAANRAFQSPGTQGLQSFGNLANPYIDSASRATLAPITEALTEQVLPNIRQGAISSGQLGGSRQGLAEDNAVGQYVDRAAQAIAPYQNQLYSQALAGDISGGLQTQRLQSAEGQGYLGAATQALGSVPQISALQAALGTQSGFLPSQVYSSVGAEQQGYDQRQQDALYNAYLTNQFLPFTIAQQILHGGSGIPGGDSQVNTRSTPGLLDWITGLFKG